MLEFRNLQARKGFGIIEVIVVVAITGILAVIAAPSIEPMLQRMRNKEAAQSVIAAAREARTESQLRRQNVVLSLSESSIQVAQGATVLRSYTINAKSPITATATQIIFQPNKKVNNESTIEIYCSADKVKKGRIITIDINGNAILKEENSQC